MNEKTTFTPSLTMLYKDFIVLRARLEAMRVLVTLAFSEEKESVWCKALNAQTGANIKVMIGDEAKKGKQWANELAAALQKDVHFCEMEAAVLEKSPTEVQAIWHSQ